MSFPTVSGITYGEVNRTSSVDHGNLPGLLGQTPDGALFRWTKAGASALNPFELVQSAAVNSSNDGALDIVGGTDSGAFTVTVINQKSSVATDEYKGGFLVIDTGPGEGRHLIAGNDAASSGDNITIKLDASSPLREALSSGTTKVGLWHNLYNGAIVAPTTLTGIPLGVPQVSVPAGHYFWAQSGGLGNVETDDAPAVNTPLAPSAASAGSLQNIAISSAGSSASLADRIQVAIGISAGAGADKVNMVKFILDR